MSQIASFYLLKDGQRQELSNGDCSGAVSYTHLDVYKRQVERFPFPASFEEQQYMGDEGKIHVYSWDGRQETTLVGPYSVQELYLEHFGE